ncbi:ABC transporter substrate-binding protein [Brenneria corticis]|uniref:Aliphatic sulfonate ABC transporter substrate-binding protein n=1 Tax=Brenneria corticis TaxID=2173106 RepID=A0A2U1TN24_9GAMM|nr:ABC transporter substrate-binding protein [Brenneria sp. CFCC 11842]PWC10789.1 aliphatic sulfonate ABC transporter substrate-binding protein [Brenneria sp. CFCC 11842]
MKIRLGSHPNNLSLFILRHRGTIEPLAAARGWQVEWLDYQQGARSGEWLVENRVDVVGTGSTPPITAQTAGLAVAYLASSPPRDASCALLARAGQDLTSLRGTRLAAMVGSFTDHFLARLLQKQGLLRDDVQLLDIQGQSALDALLGGEIDGWLAIDPWLTRARAAPGIVTLASVGDEIVNRSVFWTRQAWLNRHPDAAAWVVQILGENDRWIVQNTDIAARLLARHLNPAIRTTEWRQSLEARPWGITPADDALIAEQQRQADDLFAVGFIPSALTLLHRRTA